MDHLAPPSSREIPIATHRCYQPGSLRCDNPGSNHSWSCKQALCSSCVDLDWDLYYPPKSAGLPLPSRSIMTTMPNVTRFAEQGCLTCSILQEGILAVSKSIIEQESLYSDWLAMSLLSIEIRHDGPLLVELCSHEDEDTTYLLVEFYSLKGMPVHFQISKLSTEPIIFSHQYLHPALGHGENLPLALNLKKCLAFVNQHMNNCNQFHSVCSSTQPRLRPTRILDIGLEDDSHKLVLTTLERDDAKYVALSHCWGDCGTIISTTKGTIDQRQHEITFSELPRTFQDAVQITRALGIRYLWIDSLCIIQDDDLDWQSESAKMADIYLGSCLTIAATGSTDSTGGCFFKRWTSQPGGMRSNIETFEIDRTLGGHSLKAYVRQGVNNGHSRMYGYASTSTTTAPLLHRAWAYQERILAPRVLHFHMEEMFWECKTCTLCECGYLDWEQEHKDSGKWCSVELNLQLKNRIAQAIDESTPIGELHKLWLDIVEEYSMLAITKDSDRLPALSGLASFLSRRVQSPYLAGLWQEHLPIGLLWHRCSVMYSLCSREAASKVPTWSWASIIRLSETVEEAIQLNHITYDEVRDGIVQDPRFRIVNANCVVAGTNPFGEVSGGTISIKGALIIAKYTFPLHQTRPQLQFGEEKNDAHVDIWGPKEPAEVFDEEMVFCLLFGTSCYDFAGHALILKLASANTYVESVT